MSCEEDDDWWDDPKPIVDVKQINIENMTISKSELLTIENALILCLDRKLERLNLLLKQMNVYQVDDSLIVNDRYNIALNFIEIVKSFGIDISVIQIQGLKGKTYLINDKITKLLKVLGVKYDFLKIIKIIENSKSVNFETINSNNYENLENVYDGELSNFLLEIKTKGFVSVNGTETFIDGISKGVDSDNSRVTQKLKTYLESIKKEVCDNNKHLQNGSVEILYTRARQMGYSVEKIVKGKEIQLVLERIE